MGIQSSYYLSRLANDCRSIASGISYNNPEQATIKHILHECAHALQREIVEIYRGKDGKLYVRDGKMSSRRLTIKESICYFILKDKLKLQV